ncbi:MAG: tryptophan-rich sensory protein [Winogradskyella sp.]|uniref:TspO/MBR family protein n=1 Tax=Winogradskyella sp. TaxID=1883156 RepID=UPI0017950B76|nr:tryptophan-rich sensory protein [Winogradskyella sp.]
MKKIQLFILFFILNFGGLAIGSWLMGDAISDDWYVSLNKAPWTPPGPIFGIAWTAIMLCFSIYLSYLFYIRKSRHLIFVYSLALILNVSWNFVFFNQQLTSLGLLNLIALTLIIAYLFISFGDEQLSKLRYLLLPYIIWLCTAISLNGFIIINN